MSQPTWTITGKTSGDKPSYRPSESFATKAQAVQAMESQRMPKTPILRIGNDYIFTLKGDK